MKSSKSLAAAAVSAFLCCGSFVANAATCTQADLAGVWRVHIIQNGTKHHCTFAVAANSALTAKLQCLSATTRYILQPGGKLTMSAPGSCTFTGNFTLTNSGQNNIVLIKDGILSKNHEIGSALGTFGGSTVGAAFDLTRQ